MPDAILECGNPRDSRESSGHCLVAGECWGCSVGCPPDLERLSFAIFVDEALFGNRWDDHQAVNA